MENNAEEEVKPRESANTPGGGGLSFDIVVSPDEMEAFLVLEGAVGVSEEEARTTIKQMLARKKVVFGIDETIFDQCLAEASSDGVKKYVIARGVPLKSGKDAAILFKLSDEKNIGKLDEYAKMDFRERGEIPYVKSGELLAIKIPMIKGEPGTTVYGKVVMPRPVQDVSWRVGKNVRIVGGERAEAKIDGMVYIDNQKRIEISPVFRVEGNVDYATGNINFDGVVEVSGAVCSGFRVRAGGLIAGLIEHDTKIEVDGDLTVTGGIIRSDAKVKGAIKCSYIRGCRMMAEGDVTVDTEIVDSYISCRGKVSVTRSNGRIINSTLIGKGGVETYNLGSPSSPRSVVIIGLDYQSDNEIQKLNDEIFQCEESLNKIEKKFKEIKVSKACLEEEIETIKKKVASSMDTRQKYLAHGQYKGLCARQKEMHENYHSLLDAIVSFKGKTGELKAEKQRLRAEQAKSEPDIYLIVRGIAFEGNMIRGKNASLQLTENKKNIRAHEIVIYRDLEDGGQERDVQIELQPV